MKAKLRSMFVVLLLMLPFGHALADEYEDTMKLFRDAPESRPFFSKSYGYAVFPLVGKAGYFLGAGYGTGRVYRGGTYVGDTSLSQVSFGFQLGGQAYSQIIFFEDKRAFDDFTGGNFELNAQANAVVVTAGASLQASTLGASASASGTQYNAKHAAVDYYKGMAVFTVAKGGLMYEASVGVQKFEYAPIGQSLTRTSSTMRAGEGGITPQ